jgi:CheY-like chemotaxis protein
MDSGGNMPKKILLAEDSITIQKVFELTFAQSDFSLTMVDNGTDAVRLAAEIAPDLVVADVTLPGRNGFEVASDLGAAGGTRGIPVLILSGSLGPFDEESFKRSGARGVLFKPFESQELIDKANEMLSAAESASAVVKGESPAPGTEEWDFSDVLEEVDDRRGKADAAAAPRRDDFVPAPAAEASAAGGGLSLGEFDVSVEEVGEAEASPAPPEAGVALPDAAAPAAADSAAAFPELGDAFAEPPYSPEAPCEEPPAGVTDISPALAGVEELEEIEDLEEMELLHKESEGPLSAPEPLPSAEAAPESPEPAPEAYCEDEGEVDLDSILGGGDEAALPVPDLEPAYAPKPEPEPEPEAVAVAAAAPEEDLEAIIEAVPPPEPPLQAVVPPTVPFSAAVDAAAEALAAEALRDRFAERAREIVEKVATEAVEKVMWEWMDRLSAEFVERIRETVETVAWDVIPRTAETLIREEIARIKEKEGRQDESR